MTTSDAPRLAKPRPVLRFRSRRPLVVGEVPMLLALATVLAALWIISFLILHVSQAVVHVLIFGAALSTLVHFIRVRRAHHPSHEVKEIQR